MKDTDCSELVTLRGRIDQVNRGILELLNERARLVLEVQAVKERNDISMFCPGRENEMLDSIVAGNKGPFSDAVIRTSTAIGSLTPLITASSEWTTSKFSLV